MGLSWQQGPLAPGAVGHFLVPEPLPDRLLFAEPLRRRMRVRFGDTWIADSEDVVLLHEPGRYPVAYFPLGDITTGVAGEQRAHHPAPGPGADVLVHRPRGDAEQAARGLAAHRPARPRRRPEGTGRVRLARDGRLLRGGRADRRPRRRQLPPHRHPPDQPPSGRPRAATGWSPTPPRPLVLYESGFAPRWYVPRDDVDASALTPVEGRTFCPYKGLASYYDIAGARRAAWSYDDAYAEVRRISGLVSFEPDKVEVHLDGVRQSLEPGQNVVSHGVDRNLTLDETTAAGQP